MGIDHGPSFGFDREPAISELARFELLVELAGDVEKAAHEIGAAQINRDPLLQAMLGKVIESGPNLDPTYTTHLRRMIALRMYRLPDIAARAATDHEFYRLAYWEVEREIEELRAIPGAEDLPDMWDIALEDLLRLEEDDQS